MKRILTCLIAIFLAAPRLMAGPVLDDPSLIQLHTRIFDLRSDVRNLRRDDDFIPLNDVERLGTLIKMDPSLPLVVVHIQETPQPALDFWKSLQQDWEFPLLDGIPDAFIVDGFQTRTTKGRNKMYLLVPKDDPTDFYVRCAPRYKKRSSAFGFCAVLATYAPDPNIRLLARVYYPVPPFHFREIAHRIREIAYCLDVTEAVNNGTYKPAAYVDPDKELPALRNCCEPIS